MAKRTDVIQERHHWMDLARILACFAVIIIHSQGNTLADRTVDSLCRWAVPVFIMISGTNFLKKDREISITKMWRKYILPLFVVFLTWSLLYAVWTSYVDVKALNFEFAKTVVINTLNGHYHLWYIWMTIGLYAVTPFIKKITDNCNQKELIYYLSVAFVYLSFVFIVEFYPFSNFASLAIDLRITMVSGFLIYFVGGYTLSQLEYNKRITVLMIAVGILSATGEICFAVFDINYNINSYFTPFSIGISFSIYWILSRFTENFCRKFDNLLRNLSEKTLMIYMGHPFCISILKKVFALNNYGLPTTLAVATVSFFICLAFSYILSLTKITKKLFVGK